MRGGLVLALVIAVGLVAYLTGRCSAPDGAGAERVAAAEGAAQAAEVRAQALSDSMARLDSVAAVRVAEIAAERDSAEQAATAAGERAAQLARRLRDRLGDDARPLLDSLTAQHANQTGALRTVIEAQTAEIRVLHGRLLVRDTVIAALRTQLTAEQKLAEEWQRRYERETSWWRGLGKSSGTLAIGAAVGVVAGLALGG